MATTTTTFGQLASIAERSPGYAVLLANADRTELSNFRFDRTPSGRRKRWIVLVDYAGRTGIFEADSKIDILD